MDKEGIISSSGFSAGFSTSAYLESLTVSTGSALVVEGMALISEGGQLLNGSLCIFTGISSLGPTIGSNKVTASFDKEKVFNDAIENIKPTNEEIEKLINGITR